MAVTSTYYLDAANLSLATSVYLDAALSLLAPDGFYREGTITRQQSAGILLAVDSCDTCGTTCGESIEASGNAGIYLINLNAGDTPSDIGAVIVQFNPQNVPDGIRVTYDGNVYNTLCSPTMGLLQSSNPTGFTVVGSTLSDCGLTGNTTIIPAAVEYLYDGAAFVATGNTQSITLSPGDINLTSPAPGFCTMVIPKPTPTPSILNFEVIGNCGPTVWDIIIDCPTLLPSFQSSLKISTPTVPCDSELVDTFYFARVHTPDDGYLGLYDYVFQDPYGETPVEDGTYLVDSLASPNQVIDVLDGIVRTLTTCTP